MSHGVTASIVYLGLHLIQVHVFTFEHLEVGRLNSGRDFVSKGRIRDTMGQV